MVLVTAGVGAIGATGVIRAADQRTADVERIDGLSGVLAEAPDPDDESVQYPAENYLLVGSDARDVAELTDADYAAIGNAEEVAGRRSDTIMVMRREHNGGVAIMSLPRDLWVEIAGTGKKQRINTAYNDSPERLAATVSESLGIPIHHYVEVDFAGFKDIVDELGGVNICVWNPVRDIDSGLNLVAGCQKVDGVMGLAFARSRHFEEWDGVDWREDPRADLGRIERQQVFIRAAVDGAIDRMQSSPFGSGDTISAISESIRIDPGLDPIDAGEALRSAVQKGFKTYALPVEDDTVGDAAVLRLGEGAETVLAYFRGEGPAPIEYETTSDPSGQYSIEAR
jgi:LCP family protein required for cell wall assembly